MRHKTNSEVAKLSGIPGDTGCECSSCHEKRKIMLGLLTAGNALGAALGKPPETFEGISQRLGGQGASFPEADPEDQETIDRRAVMWWSEPGSPTWAEVNKPGAGVHVIGIDLGAKPPSTVDLEFVEFIGGVGKHSPAPVEGDSCDCEYCHLRRKTFGPDPGRDARKAAERPIENAPGARARPPLGVMPRSAFLRTRAFDLAQAIARATEPGVLVGDGFVNVGKWTAELSEIVREMNGD